MKASLTLDPAARKDLRSCGPLSDPVRATANWIVLTTVFTLLTFLGVMALVLFGRAEGAFLAVAIGAGILIGLSLPAAMWLVLAPAYRSPIFYLRAFRSDAATVDLRRLLKVALGKKYRLCGIRPPRERISWISRILLTARTGFQYAGSNLFDLESADHNWMARLLSSYSRARFLFIDVRDVTVHVETEIRLSYLAMGPQRCIFLTNERHTDEEWAHRIIEILGLSESEFPDGLYLLECPHDQSSGADDFVTQAREMIDLMPTGMPDIAGGLSVAHSHVAPADWKTPFWEKDSGQFLLGFLFTQGVVALLVGSLGGLWGGWAARIPVILVGGTIMISYLAALRRSWIEARWPRRLSKSVRPEGRYRRAGFATLLTFLWLFSMVLLLGVSQLVDRALSEAHANQDLQKVRSIDLAMFAFYNDNQAYPTGKTSTEIFQKLIDAGDLTADSVYFDMPGKLPPTSNTLRPENVCFDVTAGVSESSPDATPLVFSTGFQVTYGSGASAKVIDTMAVPPVLVLGNKGLEARMIRVENKSAAGFTPSDFDGGTSTFLQVTP